MTSRLVTVFVAAVATAALAACGGSGAGARQHAHVTLKSQASGAVGDWCTTDDDCNGGAGGTGVGSACSTDPDCNNGQSGSGLVCSKSGNTAGTCIAGFHSSSDCSGEYCDTTTGNWQCMPYCSSDLDCNNGNTGAGVVCSNSGDTSGECITGCHQDSDCGAGNKCDAYQCAPIAGGGGGGSGYNVSVAVSYADNHWNDGVGLCADFVSAAAVTRGGLGISYTDWVPTLFTELGTLGYSGDPGASSACAGDIVIFSNPYNGEFCPPPGHERDSGYPNENCSHTAIVVVGGSSPDSILVDAHNNARYHDPLSAMAGGWSDYRVFHVGSCN